MTAKEYLIEQLNDPCPEATSFQTRKALVAYAIRMHKNIEGYGLDSLERLLKSMSFDSDFIETCSSFVSNCCEYMSIKSSLPKFEE